MTYKVTNHYREAQSYKAANGREVRFEPGETKEMETVPPDREYWSVEELDTNSTREDVGGEDE